MTDEIINQAINEAIATAPAEATPQEPIETTTEGTASTEPQEPIDVPFPKKAVNALSRRDKQIGKLQAERAALQAELQKYREVEEQKANKAPVAEDFESYDDYIDAKQDFKIAKMQRESAPKAEIPSEQKAWQQERMSYAAQKANETAKTIPDYTATINANIEFINSLPEGIVDTLYESSNGGLALYVLAKEGSLYELSEMSERAAAIAIGRAEARGNNYLTKPITKAPAPIGGLKGTGQSNKAISGQSSYAELAKWLDS